MRAEPLGLWELSLKTNKLNTLFSKKDTKYLTIEILNKFIPKISIARYNLTRVIGNLSQKKYILAIKNK